MSTVRQEWLARKLSANGIGYTKLDNVFIHVEDLERAQAFADRFPRLAEHPQGRGGALGTLRA